MTNILQKHLHKLEAWSTSTGFRFSTEKTKCVLFSKTSENSSPLLKMHGHSLKFYDTVKFLGMTLDSKLTWRPHIQNLVASCRKGRNILKMVANKSWEADTNTLIKIYRTLIRSRIDYGSIAYNSATPYILKPLDSIHNAAIRIALGAFRTSPIDSILCQAAEPALSYRRAYLSLSYATTIAVNPQNPTKKNVFSDRYKEIYNSKIRSRPAFYERINRYQQEFQIEFPRFFQQNYSVDPPWLISRPKCITTLVKYDKHETNSNLIKAELLSIINDLPKRDNIYTDASKTNLGTAAAVVTSTKTIKFRLSNLTSIFTAELYAILQALMYIQETSNASSLILSDSLSAINALKSPHFRNPLIQKVYRTLHSIQTAGRKVFFIWIPSHIGIDGNELADDAAYTAIEDPDSILVPNSIADDFKSFIKKQIMEDWQKNWNNSSSKLRECKGSVKQWVCNLTSRRDQVVLHRLRIGHTKLTHSYLISKDNPPTCESCQMPLSVKHILLDCTKYSSQRLKFNISGNLQKVLNSDLDKVIKYLIDTKLLKEI